jgi:predicted N-acetyltransferase YhbS
VISIEMEAAADAAAIEGVLDLCFGPGRHLKTCQRLRDGRLPARDLALVARDNGRVVGTIRFWDVDAGGTEALLLGPVAVHPGWRSGGIGSALIGAGLALAEELGHAAAILVGDPEYYGRFGFRRALTLGLTLPGPVEPRRFLGLELAPGALRDAVGPVRPAGRSAVPGIEPRRPTLAAALAA